MPRRTKEEAAVTRETLLKAGLAVFSQKGYAAAALEDVAKEAGVTRGAIYWHFGSKSELYNALLNQYSARAGEIVQTAAAEGGRLADILRRVFIRLLVAVESDPALRAVMEISLFKTERTQDLQASQRQQAENGRALLASIAGAMQQGIEAGELRGDLPAMELARAFIAFNNGAIALWLNDPTAFSLKDSAPDLAEIYLNGILPHAPREARA